MRTIRVKPIDGGWTVEADPALCPLVFLSGAAAERQAIVLATAMARQGELLRVIIHDRTGAVAGTRTASPQLRVVGEA